MINEEKSLKRLKSIHKKQILWWRYSLIFARSHHDMVINMLLKLQLKKNSYTLSEKMFLVIWTIYSFSSLVLESELALDYSSVTSITLLIAYATILLQFLALFIIRRFDIADAFKYFVFLLALFFIELNISNKDLLVYALFVILAQYIDLDKLLRYDIKLKCIYFIIIVGMNLIGITEDYTYLFYGNYKHSFGFTHPNAFTCYILIILVEWLCVRYNKMKLYEWIMIVGISFLTMIIGGGRSSVYTFFAIFLMFILSRIFPNFFYAKPVKILFIVAAPLMGAISFTVLWLYGRGSTLAITLNSLLSGRLYYAMNYFNVYGIKLFGQEMRFVSTRSARTYGITASILDNAYFRCLLLWGAIAFIFIMVAYCILIWKMLKSYRLELALFCLFFVVVGFGESYMLNLMYNLSLLGLLGFKDKNDTGLY